MTANFKHIDASEQIQDGTVTASLLAPDAAVLTVHSDSNANLTGDVQLVSGSHITLSQTGQAITVSATGELSQTLTDNHIFVGNVSNIATDVPMSGDATIVASGALTLATVNSNIGSFTNANITVDAKGRITAATNGSNAGANTTLSNLTSPTALNQDILADSDGSRSLGSSSIQFSQLYTYNVISNIDDLDLISTFNVYLASGPSSDIVLNAGSGHINADTHNVTNMADPVDPQDAATKNYVDTHSSIPGGSNTSIQFNNSGVFGGDSFVTYDGSQAIFNVIDNFGGFKVKGRSGGEASISLQPDTISDGTVGQWILYTNGAQLSSPNDFAIFNSGSESPALNIQASTNFIGIGQSNPQAKLHVTGGSLQVGDPGNDQSITFGGTNAGLYWSSSGTSINYNAGSLLFSVVGLSNAVTFQATTGYVGIGTTNPQGLLDLTSTTQGFLPPRMTTVQMNTISSPAEGLIVYTTDNHQAMLYNGSSWVILG